MTPGFTSAAVDFTGVAPRVSDACPQEDILCGQRLSVGSGVRSGPRAWRRGFPTAVHLKKTVPSCES